jgi:hypothetical protein
MTKQAPQALRELWGPIGQIGYIVHDLATAMQHWTDTIGVGPWRVADPAPFDRLHYQGAPTDAEVSIGLAFMGDVQIELISQGNDAPSMYRDLLDTYGEGAQHICFYPADYEAALAAGLHAGMTLGQDGQIWGVEFSYLLGDGGRVIELADLPDDMRTARHRAIASAAQWNDAQE